MSIVTPASQREARAMPRALLAIACIVSLLATGCAGRMPPQAVAPPQPAGEVGYRVVPPASEGRHEVRRGQAASGGEPIVPSVVLPDYPVDWLSRGLPPLRADVLVVVDESGGVARVDVDQATLQAQCEQCASAFSAAITDALLQWRFAPLEISDWVDGPDLDGDGEADSVQRAVVATRPYSLRLQFSFAVRDGRGVVTRVNGQG